MRTFENTTYGEIVSILNHADAQDEKIATLEAENAQLKTDIVIARKAVDDGLLADKMSLLAEIMPLRKENENYRTLLGLAYEYLAFPEERRLISTDEIDSWGEEVKGILATPKEEKKE